MNHIADKKSKQFWHRWHQKVSHHAPCNPIIICLSVSYSNTLCLLVFSNHCHHNIKFNSVIGAAVMVLNCLPPLARIGNIVFFFLGAPHNFQKKCSVIHILNILCHLFVRKIQFCSKNKTRIPCMWCKFSTHHPIVATINKSCTCKYNHTS